MEGDLSLLSIPDLLQMICLGGYSRDIHLFDGPTQLGVIAIRNGRVDRCFGFGGWGEAAFFKLVSLRRGRYKVNDAQDMSASDATLTPYSWQELLMEAARQQDEAARMAQTAAASAGRVIPFPTPTTVAANVAGFDGARMESAGGAGFAEAQFDFPSIFDAPVSATSQLAPVTARADSPRPSSDTGKHLPIRVSTDSPRPGSDTGRHAPILSAAPAAPEERVRPELTAVPPAPALVALAPVQAEADDVTNLLQEATACYLRRDLARAEALLQKCLELRPGDKRALQNLERSRRKKPT